MAKEKSQPLNHALLDRLMTEAGESNVGLGHDLGVSDTTVLRWRRGEHGPSGAEAIRLARRYRISVATLYGWKETTEEAVASRLLALPSPVRAEALRWISDLLDGAERRQSSDTPLGGPTQHADDRAALLSEVEPRPPATGDEAAGHDGPARRAGTRRRQPKKVR